MFILDLNYLENVTEGLKDIAGGRGKSRRGGRSTRANFRKTIDVDIDTNVDIDVHPDISGNTATGFVDAFAEGYDTFTDAELILTADEGSSSSVAQGIAAVDDGYYYYY